VDLATDFPERFRPGTRVTWKRAGEEREIVVASARPHARRMLLRFEQVSGVDQARALCGGELFVPEAEAFRPPEGFHYAHEIRGWPCEDAAGNPLGEASELETTAAGPLLTVLAPGGKHVLVPFVEGIVVRVDRAARRIVLDPPGGLFEL
jgi:16S rRNA processing protein RimM